MHFVLMYMLVTMTLLCRPTQEKKWFNITRLKFCSQMKLRSSFLIRLKLDICFGSDGKETSSTGFNLQGEGRGINDDVGSTTYNKYESNSTSEDTADTIISVGLVQASQPLNTFFLSLEQFERKFHWTTFSRLAAIGAVERRENGMSFVQSGLFLFMALLAISMEMDDGTKNDIQKTIAYRLNDTDLTVVLQEVTSWLPTSSASFKFRSLVRLVLKDGLLVPNIEGIAEAMKLELDAVANSETNELTSVLNDMVYNDSGGAMKDTFEEEELVKGICAVLLTTLYIRPRWRVSPVVLNGTTVFYDADNPRKLTRMIRINDDMLYAKLDEFDAEAVQIQYEDSDLALLVLVPRGNSLRGLASRMASTSLSEIYRRMENMRVAVTLPLYTLRMTLLLQNKLEQMGITKLFMPKSSNASDCETFLLSHAVQRIMFWSEAGRHAFKDDGIQWDPTPKRDVIVNRPYLFYVRWKNVTLLNGNFVL